MGKILSVGFELEGGWAGEKGLSPFPDISLIADHSINGQTLGEAKAIKAPHVGELVSPVFSIQTQDWKSWLSSKWPNAEPVHRTNRTCGFHIHVGFGEDLTPFFQLSSKTFLLDLRDRMIELGKELDLPKKHVFWERMHGGNSFCTLFFDAAPQMEITHKGGVNRQRYGWLNFCTGLHGTLEFRALPTFRDAHIGVRFAEEYFLFVERWLSLDVSANLVRSESFRG